MEKTDRSMIFFSSYQVNALLFCTLLLHANSIDHVSMISDQAPWQRQNRRDEVLLRFQLKLFQCSFLHDTLKCPKCVSFIWSIPIPKKITFWALEYDICIQFWKHAGPFWGSLMSISSAWFQGQRRLHRLAEPVQEQIACHNYLIALH